MRLLILVFLIFSFSVFGFERSKERHHERRETHHEHHVMHREAQARPKTSHHVFHHATGLKRNLEAHESYKEEKIKRGHFLKEVAPLLPGKFNLGPKVSPPEDQGNCGSCWDFAILKSLRSELMLAGVDPGKLEFNYLLNNCSGVQTAKMMGCSGGDFPAGDGVKNPYGPGLDKLNPYIAKEGACKFLPVAGSALTWNLVGTGNRAPSFQELATANYNNGKGHVLVVDMDAEDGKFQSYMGGIFQGNGKNLDHMVNMIGWDCQTSIDANGNCAFNSEGLPLKGDGYLIGRNNWNTNWGLNGDFYIRYGANMFADTAMYFEIVKPNPPSPIPVPIPPPNPIPVPPPSPSPTQSILVWILLAIVATGGIVAIAYEAWMRKLSRD